MAKRKRTRRAYGSGTVYQRKSDGRWIAAVYVHGRRRYATGRTEDEATDRMARRLSTSFAETATVADLLTRWREDVLVTQVRARTLAGYRAIIDQHLVPHLGDIPLRDLTAADVQRMSNRIGRSKDKRTGRVYSPRTVGHILACLRAGLNQAMRWDLLERNVASLVSAPRVPERRVEPLTAEQGRVLLDAISGDPWEALYVLALTTAMRQGELLGLRWQDIDWKAPAVHVRQTVVWVRIDPPPTDKDEPRRRATISEPKTSRSRRTIPLSALAVAALRKHQKRQAQERVNAKGRKEQGLVFARPLGSPLEPSRVTEMFQAHLVRAKLPRQTFHGLRHAGISLIIEQTGGDLHLAMDIAGHSTITLTANVYGHIAERSRKRAAEAMDAALGTPREDVG